MKPIIDEAVHSIHIYYYVCCMTSALIVFGCRLVHASTDGYAK